jgi:hypothetical protein
MNTHPIPAVALSTSAVAAVARLRADCHPWSVLVEELDIPAEFHPDIDLLPLFHPDWPAAYAVANRQAEADAFAEAQRITRRLMKLAETPAVRVAAMRRAGNRPTRKGAASKDTPLVPIPGHALAYRLARGETVEGIAAAYLAGLVVLPSSAR